MATRARPVPTPETAHFWEGTAAGEIRLQRCGSCAAAYFPPQPFCPRCGRDDVTIVVASGAATLVSAIVSYLPAPGFEPPYVIAVVELAEGVRMLTNLVDVDPDLAAFELDDPLEATFVPVGDHTLVQFRPALP